MTSPRDAAKNLETPAGIDAPGDEGVITNMSARRKEMIERMKQDADELGTIPPDKASVPDDRNTQAYEEDHRDREAITDRELPD